MTNALEVTLPIVLLGLVFLLKLLVDRSATLLDFVEATLELPVDIAFLSTCFVVASTISAQTRAGRGLLVFAIYIIGSILVVFMWRRSRACFEKESLRRSVALAAANYTACVTGLVFAIRLVIGR